MQRGQAFKAKRQVFQACRTSIIQGIDDNYSRHEGQALKAWRTILLKVWRTIIQSMDDKYFKGMDDKYYSRHG